MKISLEALEHWGFVVAMAVFSFMAYRTTRVMATESVLRLLW